jgi:hypothetical protein
LPSTVERMKPWPSSEDRRQRRPLKHFNSKLEYEFIEQS